MAVADTWVVVSCRKKVFAGIVKRREPHPDPTAGMVVEVDAGWGRLTLVVGPPPAGRAAARLPDAPLPAADVCRSVPAFDVAAAAFVLDPAATAIAPTPAPRNGEISP